MAEMKCSKCGAILESEDEICGVCDDVLQSVKTPSEMAPPPPSSLAAPRAKLVGDIMTRKIATLFEGESLADVEAGLRRVRFRHFPVVGPEGYLIGLVSQRDLLHAFPSPLDANSLERKDDLLSRNRVGDIMARDVKTVSSDTPLEKAGQIMIDEKRDCLLVVNDSGDLIGLVTATDYIRLAITCLQRK